MTLDEARTRIGEKVIYRTSYGYVEEVVITSVNDVYVFVRYGDRVRSAATAPEALTPLTAYRGES